MAVRHLVWSGILFSTSLIFLLRAVLVTNPLTLSILFPTSSGFVLRAVLVISVLVPGILLSASSAFLSKLCLSALQWFMLIKEDILGI